MTIKTKRLLTIALILIPFMALFQIFIMPKIRVSNPSLFGLQGITHSIYVEPSMSNWQKWQTYTKIVHAEQTIKEFFGSNFARPKIIACITAFCHHRFGGKTNAPEPIGFKNYTSNIVRLTRQDIEDRYRIRYKLAKMELVTRFRTDINKSQIPVWFQEGLATYLSGNPRFGKLAWYDYLRHSPHVKDIQSLKTVQHWKQAEKKSLPVQLLARQEFARWFTEAGQTGFLKFIENVNIGQSFKKAFATQMQASLK